MKDEDPTLPFRKPQISPCDDSTRKIPLGERKREREVEEEKRRRERKLRH